jgi:hypothetical protein
MSNKKERPESDDPQNDDELYSQEEQAQDNDIWSTIANIVEAEAASKQVSEREDSIALWETASLEPHDIHALHRQLVQFGDEFERQLEEVAPDLLSTFKHMRKNVAQYSELEGSESLEHAELRIQITEERRHLDRLAGSVFVEGAEGLMSDLVGFSNPERALRFDELVRERVENMIDQASKFRDDNDEVGENWEEIIRALPSLDAQLAKLKELMATRLSELGSEQAPDRVIEIVSQSYDEFDENLDGPSKNVAYSLIYNDFLRKLIVAYFS